MKFEWDASKAAANFRKHGVSFDEAEEAFADPYAIRVYDERHSTVVEDRFLLIGLSSRTRVLFVVHLELDERTVRIISARKATSNERRDYEENRRLLGGSRNA